MQFKQFNSGVDYKGRILKWDTVIEQKTSELGRFLVGKLQVLDFAKRRHVLEKTDYAELRKRILSLRPKETTDLRIGNSTLHYLRMKAESRSSFKEYGKIRKKLESQVGLC